MRLPALFIVVALFIASSCLRAEWETVDTPVGANTMTYGGGYYYFPSYDENSNLQLSYTSDLVAVGSTPIELSVAFADFADFLDGKVWVGVQAGGRGYLLQGTSPSALELVSVPCLVFQITRFNDLYVASGGGAGTRNIITSTDGVTWTAHDTGTILYQRGIASGNGRVISVANSNEAVFATTSTDGVNWSTVEITPENPNATYVKGLVFANGVFVAYVGGMASGPDIDPEVYAFVSTDGVGWEQVTIPGYYQAGQIIAYDGGFLATALDSPSNTVVYALTSTDGLDWEAAEIGAASSTSSLFVAGQAAVTTAFGFAYYEGELPIGPAPAFPAPWEQAEQIDGDLAYLSWYGYFFIGDNGFYYHAENGWCYTSSLTTDDLWIYDLGLGWIYTNASIYPALYSDTRSAWLYYLMGGEPAARWFYDYGTSEWFFVGQ